ncbi:MAG TPA: spore coat protein CotJB [Firmicutes bacterium]|uniref:Spore coat protein CotJB n=1 Tax=Candidatus Fermentithermobacillus carboniphilus TaxID=3085328 RepID=A0AAT9LB21_9FIRM|nr:MAG: spore coat protein CotJB [Candidatus Fermentithermobacillus carboniphilus]HHW19354.1 spore coat protein CotJB [Candidatus Fermentithermobacillaceae bacterium]
MDPRQKELLMRIMELEFACIDLDLYLATHPDDTRALQDFKMRSQELMNAKMEYELAYGPLLNYGFGTNPGRTWQWIDEPWPWEINWRRSGT